MKRIDPADLLLRPFQALDQDWALLVAGRSKPNPMTVSWGGLGTLWDKPVVTVYVRPVRWTYGLLEAHPEFTLNFLPSSLRPALELCGSRSGRDTDKWRAAGIHPAPSAEIAVPRVKRAVLAFECRLLATLDLDPDRFLDQSILEFYPKRDFHRAYVGEAVVVWASAEFTDR